MTSAWCRISSNNYDVWWIILSLKLMAESTHLKIQVLMVDEFFVGLPASLDFLGSNMMTYDEILHWFIVVFSVSDPLNSRLDWKDFLGVPKRPRHLSREVPRNPMRWWTGMLPHEEMIGKWFHSCLECFYRTLGHLPGSINGVNYPYKSGFISAHL